MKKDEIIKATIDYIAENDIASFSTKKLLEKIGCSEGLIYIYYPSKESLFTGCIDYLIERNRSLFENEIPEAIKGETEPDRIAKKAMGAYLRHYNTGYNETRFYFKMANSIHAEMVKGLEREYRRYAEHAFDGTPLEPFIRRITDAITAETLHLLLTRIAFRSISMVDESKRNDPRMTELIMDLFFKGVNGVTVLDLKGGCTEGQ